MAGLASLLIAAICGVVRAAGVALPSSPSSNAIVASLEYQETANGVTTWGVAVLPQNTPFKKEPGAGSGRVLRGVLIFGGDPSNSIAFLWQREARKLYLDLNGNRDLTDDPAGVYVAGGAGASQTFTNVHLDFKPASGRCRVLADITLFDLSSQVVCNLAVRSFWQGKVTLQGRDWQVGAVPNALARPDLPGTSGLLLRAWEKRTQPFNANDGLLDIVPFSRNLFVDGRAYQVEWISGSQNGEARPALQFVEQSPALGELKITGQFISRLLLSGGPYEVILNQPAGVMKVPTGRYSQTQIQLQANGANAFRKSNQSQSGQGISIGGTPAVLNAGGPLSNSVTATRHGHDLLLDYVLTGAGGEAYQMAAQNRSKPPGFAVYQGEKKIGSGEFEFG